MEKLSSYCVIEDLSKKAICVFDKIGVGERKLLRTMLSETLLVLLLISLSIVGFNLQTGGTSAIYVNTLGNVGTQQEVYIFVVGIAEKGNDFDFVGLVSSVTASTKNHGKPYVLFSLDYDNGEQIDPLPQSFVQLYESVKPNVTYVIGDPDFNPPLTNCITLRNSDPFILSSDIVRSFWNESKRVVISNFSNFTEAVQAVPVASSMSVPLLFYFPDEVPPSTRDLLGQLAATDLIVVGQPSPSVLTQLSSYNQTILRSPVDVATFLHGVSSDTNYTILVNVADRESSEALVPKVSLASSTLAAYRRSVVYPINCTPSILKVLEFRENATPPIGISSNGSVWIGSLMFDGQIYPVAVYAKEFRDDPEMVNIDLDRNGIYNETGEGSYYTGEEISLGGRNFTLDVRTVWEETPRKVSELWLHYPSSQSIKRCLSEFYRRASVDQCFLLLAGHWDVLPFDFVDVPGTGQLSLASTSLQSQTDEDPYLDLATGRMTSITFTGVSLSLLKTVFCEQNSSGAAWKRNVLIIRSDAGITDPQVQTLSGMFRALPYFNIALYLQNNITSTTFQSGSNDKSFIYVGGHGWEGGIPAAGLECDRIPYFGQASPLVFLDGCDTGGIDLSENPSQSVALQLIEHGALAVVAPTRHSSDFPNIHLMVTGTMQRPIGAVLKDSRNFGVHWTQGDLSQCGRPSQTLSSYRNFAIHELIGDPAATLWQIVVEDRTAAIMKGGDYQDIFDDALSLGYVPDVFFEWNIEDLWKTLYNYRFIIREIMIDFSDTMQESISQNLPKIYSWVKSGGSWLEDTFISGSLEIASLRCSDYNGPSATIVDSSHQVFNVPHRLNSSYFSGWDDPWVADAVISGGSDLPSYKVLAEAGGYPVLLERNMDKGRIVISGLAAGRANKVEFVENLFAYLANTTVSLPKYFQTDLNKDGSVNILDISIVAKAYGSKPGNPNWNEIADLDKNGITNIIDISMVAKDYGKTA